MVLRSWIRTLVLAGVLAALAVPATAAASTVHGVVVHHNARAHSFVLAVRGGRLVAVHSRARPVIGRMVSVSVTPLRDGTYAARTMTVGRRARRARIDGVVTFVDRRHGDFAVSGDGASLLVRRTREHSALPSVGQDVSVLVGLDNQGDLQDEGFRTSAAQTSEIDLEGAILAVDTSARTLTISADDEGVSGQSLTVDVPSTIDMSAFTVGEEVELTVAKQADGTFLMQGAAGDTDQQQANNPSDQQGSGGDGGTGGSGGDGGSGGGGWGD